jgi:hypothetical protein
VTEKPPLFEMRSVCVCGSKQGRIFERGAQDVVRCAACDKFQYNAPRVETGKAVRSVATVHAAITSKRRAVILMRANCRCELCHRAPTKPSDELHVGHAVSVKRGIELGLGDDEINHDDNLLAMCAECNLGLGAECVSMRLLVSLLMGRLRKGVSK